MQRLLNTFFCCSLHITTISCFFPLGFDTKAVHTALKLTHNSIIVGEEFLPCCNVSERYKDNTTQRSSHVLAEVDIWQILAEFNGKFIWHIILLVAHVSRTLIGAIVHILTNSKWVQWVICEPAVVRHHEESYSVSATAWPEDHFRDALVVSINQNAINASKYKRVSDGLEENGLVCLIDRARVQGNYCSFRHKSFGDKHSGPCNG